MRWTILHEKKFWEDNYRDFEFNSFEYIEKLVNIIKQKHNLSSNYVEQKSVACFDVEQFCSLYPQGAQLEINQNSWKHGCQTGIVDAYSGGKFGTKEQGTSHATEVDDELH